VTKLNFYSVVLEDMKSLRKCLIPDVLRGKAAQPPNTRMISAKNNVHSSGKCIAAFRESWDFTNSRKWNSRKLHSFSFPAFELSFLHFTRVKK